MSANKAALSKSNWYRTMLILALALFFVSMTFPIVVPALAPSLGPVITSLLVFTVMIGGFVASIAVYISGAAGRRKRWMTAVGALLGVPVGLGLLYLEVSRQEAGVLGFLWLPVGVLLTTTIGYVVDRVVAARKKA